MPSGLKKIGLGSNLIIPSVNPKERSAPKKGGRMALKLSLSFTCRRTGQSEADKNSTDVPKKKNIQEKALNKAMEVGRRTYGLRTGRANRGTKGKGLGLRT